MKLKDKVAIITGGAMGNGLGIVKVFLKYGAKVAIFDYSDKINETIQDLNEYKNQIIGYRVDIRNKEAVKKCVDHVAERFGKIDILVNNAGVCLLETFDNMSDELRDKHFDINITGSWNVTKEVYKYMQAANGGAIVNLSSVTGPMVADSGEVAYATTKGANLGFTKALAMEGVAHNIRVNAIMPGYIHTPLIDSMAKVSNPENPQAVIDGIEQAIPMKRMGKIEEIGELAAFLASDESSYITGQGIVIDGGSTLPETAYMGI